jgi:hypothetical protein
MKIQSITGASPSAAVFCLIGAVGLLSAACQGPTPVREYRVEKSTECSPCARGCVTSIHSTEVLRNTSTWPVAEAPAGRPYLFTPKAGVGTPPLNPPIPNACTTASQEYPDGIRHLAGAPLYYESQNLNWEQAPPFGRW